MKDDGKMIVSLRAASPAPQPLPPEEHVPRKAAPRKKRGRAAIAGTICAILLGGALGWFAFSHRPGIGAGTGTAAASLASSSAESDQQTAAQTANIIAEVGRLIDLPTGETPTVATVTDPAKLQDQPFFANAQVGDIVLLYSVAREAYLYDPGQNKLVAVAPITTSVSGQ